MFEHVGTTLTKKYKLERSIRKLQRLVLQNSHLFGKFVHFYCSRSAVLAHYVLLK